MIESVISLSRRTIPLNIDFVCRLAPHPLPVQADPDEDNYNPLVADPSSSIRSAVFYCIEDDIATALVGMGFDRRTAKSAVAEAIKSVEPGLAADELERELFRKAVAIAGKGGKG